MMANEFTTKVRLVRCPGCRLVLPELPEFNVYKCGGCGATLQAKNRVARSTESGLNGADAVQENQTGPSSNNKEVHPGSGEYSSSQNNERDHRKPEDFNGEQLGCMNVPSENQNNRTHHSGSSDCDVEGAEASNERDQRTSVDFDDEQLGVMNVPSEEQNNGTHHNESSDCDAEGSEASHERDQSKSVDFDGEQLGGMHEAIENGGTHHSESSDCDVEGSEASHERDQSKSVDFDGEQLGGMHVASENQNNGTHHSESSDCDVERSEASNERDQRTSVDFDGEQLGGMHEAIGNGGTHHSESSNCDAEGSEASHERDQSKSVDFDGEQLGGMHEAIENSRTHHSESSDCDVEGSEASHERDQSKSVDFDGEQLGGMHVASENQNNGTHHGESSDCDVERSEASHEKDQSKSMDFDDEQLGVMHVPSEEQNNGTHHNESSDCDAEGSEASDEVFSPTEFVDNKNEEFALNENDELVNKENEGFASNGNEEVAMNDKKELADNEIEECDANGNEELAHIEVEEFAHNESEEFAHNENEDFSQEFAHNESEEFAHNENEEFTREFSSNKNEELSQKQNDELAQNQNEKFAHTENESLAFARVDLEVPVVDESSTLAEANSVDTSKKIDSDSNVRSSNAVNSVATTGNGSSPTAHIPVRESIESDTPKSSSGEQRKQPRKSIYLGFGHPRSEEFIPSSELTGTLGEMSKSPTRSSHAYDGSISSYDGMDDQLPHRHLHPLESTYKAANFLHSEERPRRDKFPARMMMRRDSEMQHQARPSWSDKKNHSMKNSNWDRDEFLEPARHERTARNWRLERHEHHQPSSAFHRISSRASYENSCPSSQLHDEFHRRPSFQSCDRFEDPEQVKMKLLEMVLDQLNKNYSLHDKENEGISGLSRKERYIPRYHSYEPRMEERFHPPNYPRYSGRYGTGSNSSHLRRFKKIPFSGEATSSSHQFDPSCSSCCPPDWQHSAQLPSTSRYNTSGLCRIHPGHNYSKCYSSCPSSPQWSVDSEYPPWGHETQSDEQRRRSQDMTNYLREKHRLAKRHFRPIAGGAPFMVCYKCFKLLQLPADFLLFKKKCHRLRCGACLEVLKFSLEKRFHIVRYEVNVVDPPPPSEAEDYGDDIDRRNMASTSQTPQADPVSCSDDYGLSYCKSCSTEDDPASTTLFHTPRGSTVDKRISQDSLDFTREFVPVPSQGKNKSIYEFSGPSPNIPKSENLSSEIQELPPRSSSPLHRLMGYSSPSAVIFGLNPSGRETSTSYSMQREKRDKN